MFVLRAEHLEALRAGFLDTLAERCAARLRTQLEWAVHSISDAILIRMVRASVRRALKAGLRLDTAIIAYVHLSFTISPNFDDHQTVRAAIAHWRLAPDDIPFALGDVLTDRKSVV